MKVYVVNELCEADVNSNNCIGVFKTFEEAKEQADEVFKSALSDLGGEEKCVVSFGEHYSQVYNDNYAVVVNIDEIEFNQTSTVDDDEEEVI